VGPQEDDDAKSGRFLGCCGFHYDRV
jgi:hypothetical protein